MKKLLFSLFVFSTLIAAAQTINGVDLRSFPDTSFEIIGEIPVRSKIVTELRNIAFDFGAEDQRLSTGEFVIKDENGDQVVFRTMIQALNFFEKYGFKMYDSYSYSIVKVNLRYIHFILRRK